MNKLNLEKVIYINVNESGDFEAQGRIGEFKVGLATSDTRGVIECIRSVNRSLFMVENHGQIAVDYLENNITWDEFTKKIGGRDKIASPTETLPIIIS